MSPGSTRWRPRRAGIINLYEYANQVFDFAGGRLLLRGHNTSGKTKALELLLPFCLDGDISPKKLDPFGTGYKDMKWNLIGCTGDLKRVGYAWLEFERVGQPGSRAAAHRRYRHAPQPRPARRHALVLRRPQPHDRLRSDAAAGSRSDQQGGACRRDRGRRRGARDRPRDYRNRLNDLLFGFGGEEQYQTMLRLMRDLRRPHLSKTLDPERVAAQLTVGLPEVDETLMRKLAGGLEQLETLERGLVRLRDVRERVRRFHQRTYSAYSRAAVRERADALRQAQHRGRQRGRAAADHVHRARRRTRASEHASEARDAAQARLDILAAEEHALVSSAAWSSVAEIETLRELAHTQARAAATARRDADDAAAAAGRARGRVDHRAGSCRRTPRTRGLRTRFLARARRRGRTRAASDDPRRAAAGRCARGRHLEPIGS